jgi:ubiquinone/menaquinone biosynthesis C-methylase UbiE
VPRGRLEMDQRDYVSILRSAIRLRGRRVLEIGGATPPRLIEGAGVLSWTSIDISPRRYELSVKDETTPSWHRFVVMDAASLAFESASVDVVYSVNCFEHIADLRTALKEIHRVLTPTGVLFTIFSPIWSGPVGHHTWVWDGDTALTFSDRVFPDWQHLAMSPSEMRASLAPRYRGEVVDSIIHYVYEGNDINRLPDQVYESEIGTYGYHTLLYHRIRSTTKPGPDLLNRLKRACPEVRDFRTLGYFWVLSKTTAPLFTRLRVYVRGGAKVAIRKLYSTVLPQPREE